MALSMITSSALVTFKALFITWELTNSRYRKWKRCFRPRPSCSWATEQRSLPLATLAIAVRLALCAYRNVDTPLI